MKRTAGHLLSSPNAAQLEMRILANHGGDKRFAFLRGRWSKFWNVTQRQLTQVRDKSKEPLGLGEIAGYGSDESDSDISTVVVEDECAVKEARRARLRDWKEKRQAAKQAGQLSSTIS